LTAGSSVDARRGAVGVGALGLEEVGLEAGATNAVVAVAASSRHLRKTRIAVEQR